MTGELIELQVSAVRYACGQMTALHLRALHDSIEQACRIPAALWWDRKAAAHAEIFNVLADAVDEPLVGRVLSSGAGLAYDLMIAAGCAADGMITSSRQRLLAHLSGRTLKGRLWRWKGTSASLAFRCAVYQGKETEDAG